MPCLASGACTMSGRGPGIAVPPGAAGAPQQNVYLSQLINPTVIASHPPRHSRGSRPSAPLTELTVTRPSTKVTLANQNFKTKTFVTCDSRVVPHRSTEQAQRCLVSEIGRDRTFSPWYEPTMGMDLALGFERLVGDPAYIKSKASKASSVKGINK